MLKSFEIYQALNALGYRLEAGKFEPGYAFEHALGNGKYLYVKRGRDGMVNKSPLVLAPETLAVKAEIDRIWQSKLRIMRGTSRPRGNIMALAQWTLSADKILIF